MTWRRQFLPTRAAQTAAPLDPAWWPSSFCSSPGSHLSALLGSSVLCFSVLPVAIGVGDDKMCWSSRCIPVQVFAWYSCNLSLAAPFLPAFSLSNKMQAVKKPGLCVRKCAGFVLLSSSQEAGGRGEGRGREWRKQADGLPLAGWAVFGGECFLPFPPCCPRGACGKKAIPLGAGLGTEDGKHPLVC